jgi:hypothetical protein
MYTANIAESLSLFSPQAKVIEGQFLNNYFAVAKYEVSRKWKKFGKAPDKNE